MVARPATRAARARSGTRWRGNGGAEGGGLGRGVLTALCGHGHFDMVAYERYLSGEMQDFELPQDRIDSALAALPAVPGA